MGDLFFMQNLCRRPAAKWRLTMVRYNNISSKKNYKSRKRFFLAAIFIAALMIALSACSAEETPSGSSESSGSTGSATEAESSAAETGAASDQTATDTPPASANGEDLVIPISDISEKATFYPVNVDGIELEVLAVTAPDGTIRTAFNTCQVCYDSGNGYYKQEGDMLICQNCGNQFGMDQVEVSSGGCNPVPIFDENKTVDDENITIPFDFLNEAKVIFANWKA
jgi:hypothetical protein